MKFNIHNSATEWCCMVLAILMCLSGCASHDNETREISKDTPKENNIVYQDPIIDVDVLHCENKVTSVKKRKDLNVKQENEYVQHNNNLVNGGEIFPYQGGYLFRVEKLPYDGGNSMFVYDDGKGTVAECQELPGNGVLLEYILDDYIYYYDSGKNSLFREKDGQVESVIEFQHYGGALRYYAEDGIYFIDIDEEEEKSYIGKSGYDGTDSHKLYKLNVAVDQVFKYQDDLWFVYHKFDAEKQRVGRISLTDNKVCAYKEIVLKGSSTSGSRIFFNNGYLYYISAGLNRLNIQEDALEQVYGDDLQGLNFTKDSIWFYTEKNLYKMNKDGSEKIMKLTGDAEGFCGIRVDQGKIYLQTYAGGLYNKFYQLHETGNIVRQWDSDEINRKLENK